MRERVSQVVLIISAVVVSTIAALAFTVLATLLLDLL